LLAALLKGAREKVEIPCPDHRTMKWLQLRIQTLRGAMERERHPQYALVTRARTSREWNKAAGQDVGCVLVISPHDDQFTSLIEKAGVKVEPHYSDLLNIPESTLDFSIEKEIDLVDPYAKFKGE
jgi:hypothetical protein